MRFALVLTFLLLGVSLVPNVSSLPDPMLTSENTLSRPTLGHPLGTDYLGRDNLSRFLHGGRRTLFISGLAALFAVGVGGLVGFMAGTMRYIDGPLMAVTDALFAIPSFLLAMMILTTLGRGALPLMLATGMAQLPAFARVARAIVVSVRAHLFVEASRSIGATPFHILREHIFTAAFPSLAAYAAIIFGYCLLTSAGLSFLGLGGEPGIPDWGVMLAESRSVFRIAPWVSLPPGLAITGIVLLANDMARRLSGPGNEGSGRRFSR